MGFSLTPKKVWDWGAKLGSVHVHAQNGYRMVKTQTFSHKYHSCKIRKQETSYISFVEKKIKRCAILWVSQLEWPLHIICEKLRNRSPHVVLLERDKQDAWFYGSHNTDGPYTSFAEEATGWQKYIHCLILVPHFPHKSLIISGSFAKRYLQLKASYASLPPCKSGSFQWDLHDSHFRSRLKWVNLQTTSGFLMYLKPSKTGG